MIYWSLAAQFGPSGHNAFRSMPQKNSGLRTMVDQEKTTMKAKGMGALLVALIVILSATGAIALLGQIDDSQFSATGASNVTGYGIAHGVTAVFGYNDTAKTWYTATITKTAGSGSTSDKVTATFSIARNATNVGINVLMIQTGNSSQDVYNLLQQNILFGSFQLSAAATGVTGLINKVDYASLFFGTAVNATATTAFSDKGVMLSDYNFSLYSNTTNYLNNKTASLNALNMFASLPTAEPQYVFWIEASNKTVNTNFVSESQTFTFYQNFQRTAGMQVYTDVGLITLAFVVLGIAIAYISSPEHYEGEDKRSKRWHEGENPAGIYEAIGLGLVVAIFIGVLGMFSPLLGGWGGALAFLAGFGVAIWVYTAVPQRQSYSKALLVGTGVGVLAWLLNIWIPFGTVNYNMIISSNVAAEIASVALILLTLAIATMGVINTKKYRLRERYTRKPLRASGKR